MKKLLLLITFLSASTLVVAQTLHRTRTEPITTGSFSFTLCSSTTSTTCGCVSSCVPAICDASGSGDCTRDPQTLTLSIAADLDVTISVANEGCGSTSGLDSGDSYSVNGTTFNGSSNTTPASSGCYYTEGGVAGVVDVVLDANRLDECITVTVDAIANGGVGGDGTSGCATPLPVDLISFRAVFLENEVSLSWKTASEENNSHFEVEHSTNGRDFQMLDKVTGNGTTAEIQQYNYMHENASTGKNYYRLRQVDFDGAFEYSDVAVVEIKGDTQVDIRPTVAYDEVSLLFQEVTRQEVQISVFDVAGRQVMAQEVEAGTERLDLQVSQLQGGLYFVQLVQNGTLITLKFVKQ